MNEPPHPEPDDTTLLASLAADDALGADEAQRYAASPPAARMAATFTTLRATLSAVPPAPDAAREAALAAALGAHHEATRDKAAVLTFRPRRQWPARVLAAAAAGVVLGVIGVSVFGHKDDRGSANTAGMLDADTARIESAGGAQSADDYSVPATIAAINAPASPVVAVNSPQQLHDLVEARSKTSVMPEDGTDAGVVPAMSSTSPALRCLSDTQVFVVDIFYAGTPAIAVRDTVSGVTQAIDEQCNVLAEAAP